MSKLAHIGSDDDLPLVRRQVISEPMLVWGHFGPLRTNTRLIENNLSTIVVCKMAAIFLGFNVSFVIVAVYAIWGYHWLLYKEPVACLVVVSIQTSPDHHLTRESDVAWADKRKWFEMSRSLFYV